LVFLEGRTLALDVLSREGARIRAVFVLAGEREPEIAASARIRGAKVIPATARALEKLSSTKTAPGCGVLVEAPNPPELDPANLPSRLVILDRIADPGNAVTLIRAAAAFGFAVALDGGVGLGNEKLLRAAAGLAFAPGVLFRIPLKETARRMILDRATVVALDPRAGLSLADVVAQASDDPLALVVGSESHGVDPVRWPASVLAKIPMAAGVESLNAGVSGAIAMYEVGRTRT